MFARRLTQLARIYLIPAVFAAACLYFIFHLITGERGFLAHLAISKELDTAQAMLSDLQQEQRALERDVALLRDTPVDLDMLEERARIELGYVRQDEMIIVYDGDE